jgi:tmRNA-binding protein
MSPAYRTPLTSSRVQKDFLRIEVQTGHVLANIALSTKDQSLQASFTRTALLAYNAVLRFMGRVQLTGTEMLELTEGIDNLRRKFVELREKQWNVVSRRLDDRIHELAAQAERFANDPEASHELGELMKAEIAEYFEREKHPSYQIDRRSSR